jgi:DNA-binding response OmpR family regulator
MLIKGGTGLDVLKKIKDKKVKVIAVTALEQDRVDEELKQLGVRYILRKPFSYEELKKVVESDL